jgi:hypothetical protein
VGAASAASFIAAEAAPTVITRSPDAIRGKVPDIPGLHPGYTLQMHRNVQSPTCGRRFSGELYRG